MLTDDTKASTAELNEAVARLKGLARMRIVVVGLFVSGQDLHPGNQLEVIASSPQDLFVEQAFEDLVADLGPLTERLCPK